MLKVIKGHLDDVNKNPISQWHALRFDNLLKEINISSFHSVNTFLLLDSVHLIENQSELSHMQI